MIINFVDSSGTSVKLVAEFSDNEVFKACLPALTELANRDGLKVITENTKTKANLLVNVCFEDERKIGAEQVASFADEESYLACLSGLEILAKKTRHIIIESMDDEAHWDLPDNSANCRL
jgi:hypothetical protein